MVRKDHVVQSEDLLYEEKVKVLNRLYNEFGYNVIPVNQEKKPIGKWNAEKRKAIDELYKVLKMATGLAITGSYIEPKTPEDENYRLVILDMDDPDKGIEILRKALGDDWAIKLCSEPDGFCGLTGPRPKGKVKCQCDSNYLNCECVNTETGEKKNLFDMPRGMYIVIRAPKNCAPLSTIRSSIIEMIVSNFEVVWGIHPSGAPYEFVRAEKSGNGFRWIHTSVNNIGPGVKLTCEEFTAIRELIESEKSSNPFEDLGEDDMATAQQLRLGEPSIDLPDDKIERLVNLIAPMWWIEDDEGAHGHDKILFGLSSLMRRAGIKYESALKVVKSIIEAGLNEISNKVTDAELERLRKTEETHIRETVEHVYKKPDAKLWGIKSIKEYVLPFVKKANDMGIISLEPDEWLSEIISLIGYHPDTVFCVPITRYKSEVIGEDHKPWGVTEYICNDPSFGIVYRKKKIKEKKENGETKRVIEKTDVGLLKWSFIKLETYYDPYFDITYANAVVTNTEGLTKKYSMIRVDKLKKELEEDNALIKPIPKWNVIFQAVKPKLVDIIVSGIVCPPPDMGYPCAVRDYFDVGLADVPVDKAVAADVITQLIGLANNYHPEPDSYLRGIIYGMFTNFSLTWKLFNLKPKMVALIGVRDSGKTTVGLILNHMFSPKVDVILPTSVLLSPARVGRGVELLTNAVITSPVVFDEAGTTFEGNVVKLEGNTANVLKNYVTQKYTWVTATGTKIPATSGVVLTANQLAITDPALEDKVIKVSFAKPIPREKKSMGTPLIRELKDKLVYFGKYYLQYAVDNWDNVKGIVLGSDWEQSAIDYFNIVLKSLGLTPLNITVEPREEPNHLFLFRATLERYVKDYQFVCRSDNNVGYFEECVIKVIDSGFVPFIKRDYGAYRITRDIERVMGISAKVLCSEIGGKVIGKDIKASHRYYGECLVEEGQLKEALGISGIEPEPTGSETGNDGQELNGEWSGGGVNS